MVLGLPFAHIPSRFAEDHHRSHDIDAIDAGQVRTGHAKQPGTQVEPRLIAFLLLEPFLALLFRQSGPCAPVFPLLEILNASRKRVWYSAPFAASSCLISVPSQLGHSDWRTPQ